MNIFEKELQLLEEEYNARKLDLLRKAQNYTETTVDDIRQPETGVFKDREREKHPSYGMVSISRNQYSGKGKRLFGSGISHGTVITIKISAGEKSRNAFSDHYFPKGTILEFQVSASQFTSMITNMNTDGTPCTLSWIKGEGYIDEPPVHNLKEEIQKDLKQKYRELSLQVRELYFKTEETLKGPVKKADKDNILSDLKALQQQLGSNLPYLQTCHTEALEDVSITVQAEAEAAITGMINRMGLETLKNQLANDKENTTLLTKL